MSRYQVQNTMHKNNAQCSTRLWNSGLQDVAVAGSINGFKKQTDNWSMGSSWAIKHGLESPKLLIARTWEHKPNSVLKRSPQVLPASQLEGSLL